MTESRSATGGRQRPSAPAREASSAFSTSSQAEQLAAQKLATEEGRFHEGLLQNVDLLRFQEDLAVARSRLVRAQADLARSWVELDQSLGLVLEHRGIRWEVSK